MTASRLLAVTILLGAGRVAAQDPRLAARLDPATRESVTVLLDAAQARRLPTEPLVQKALEGASKNAPGPRIIAAVRTLLGHLGTARGALGENSTEQELIAGAAALRAGASATSLRELRATRPGRPLAVPLAVLTDLVARGLSLETAYQSDRKSTRLNSSHSRASRMPSSA